MHKVIVIHLNGNAYQLDEDGYRALRGYLDRAADQLADNPDRAEILVDLEQAIAEKCHRFLGPHKTVVLAAEVAQIIAEMGPVDAGGEAGAEAADGGGRTRAPGPDDAGPVDPEAPRRLYRIREGAHVAGVCTGLAAYLGSDVQHIRIAFILLTLFTGGAGAIAYGVLMFALPEARTSQEEAAAWGLPFNAKEVVDRAMKDVASIGRQTDWKAHWRKGRRQWRQQRRWATWDDGRWRGAAVPPVDHPTRIVAGVMAPLFGVVRVVLFVALVFAIVSLVNTGAVFGWRMPLGTPLWAGILALAVAHHLIAAPLRATYYGYGPGADWAAVWVGLVWMVLLVWLAWYGAQHVPEIERFIENLPDAWRAFVGRLSAAGPPTPR
jgi:phage shock protein PspC (stress-responsive transcriptional regulator)